MTVRRRTRIAAVVVPVLLAASGCSWTGPNSVTLPFTTGRGSDDIRITVQLENAANLVPNSEVMYQEVAVGSVLDIQLEDWTATLTVGIESDAQVPADVIAKVAQRSLLGAEYLALMDPGAANTERAVAPSIFLVTGNEIGLDRTARYPETEEVLSAAALLLNGGGLGEIQEISRELNAALTGRGPDVREFVSSVSTFTRRLDRQRDNISTALVQLDRIASSVVGDKAKISTALEKLPEGLRVLSEQRAQIVRTLRSVAKLGKIARRVIGQNKTGLQKNLANLTKITKELAPHGADLARAADVATYPLNTRSINDTIYGDYINLILTLEVNAGSLAKNWLGTTALDGLFTGIIGGTPTGTADDPGIPAIPAESGAATPRLPQGPGPADNSSGAENDSGTQGDVASLLEGLLSPLLGGR